LPWREASDAYSGGTHAEAPDSGISGALKGIGAEIVYTETVGKLPVKISPGKLTGKKISIPGDISSQFVSAMMLIGPAIKGGLIIEITGEVLSLPYILMTKSVMEYFGAKVDYNNQVLTIHEGKYADREFTVEPDWSAASYWYEIAALSDRKILLRGLTIKSLQGDSAIAGMMRQLGVTTEFTTDGALLKRAENFSIPEYFTDDFTGCPDLGPAVAATCAALNVTSDLKGLKNFRLKESDRAAALQRELVQHECENRFLRRIKI
jgi:3-phosphoshikimate 1-carboxyvinyltransferase